MTRVEYGHPPVSRSATFSTPSVLSLVTALASFAVDRPLWALVLSIAAGLLGLIGIVVAILPGIRGGFLSLLSIILGLIGLVVAIVRIL